MALSRDAGRDLEARKGSFAGGGDAYISKMTAKYFLLLPGGNTRWEEPAVICFKHLNFLLPVNIQLLSRRKKILIQIQGSFLFPLK